MNGNQIGKEKDELGLTKQREWPTERDNDRMDCISLAQSIKQKVEALIERANNPDTLRELHAITQDATKIEITLILARTQPVEKMKGE